MKSHVTLMTEGRPVRLIVLFALPLMFGNIFQTQEVNYAGLVK